jgi:hypothetical protein
MNRMKIERLRAQILHQQYRLAELVCRVAADLRVDRAKTLFFLTQLRAAIRDQKP